MKLQKHLKDDQWKQDAPELNFECHGKGCEYLHTFYFEQICKKIYIKKWTKNMNLINFGITPCGKSEAL